MEMSDLVLWLFGGLGGIMVFVGGILIDSLKDIGADVKEIRDEIKSICVEQKEQTSKILQLEKSVDMIPCLKPKGICKTNF